VEPGLIPEPSSEVTNATLELTPKLDRMTLELTPKLDLMTLGMTLEFAQFLLLL
jgi:hypothetical protein